MSSGEWTAEEKGLYQVTWSLQNLVDSGENNLIYLYKNGEILTGSTHLSYYTGNGRNDDQGRVQDRA